MWETDPICRGGDWNVCASSKNEVVGKITALAFFLHLGLTRRMNSVWLITITSAREAACALAGKNSSILPTFWVQICGSLRT
jgi:hypothetical protein